MCEIMPAVLLGDAASAESCSSCRCTGSNMYHRSFEEIKRQVRSAHFVRDGREKGMDGTLIVSSQLNVASVMNRTMARVAHLVSGSLFGAVLLH